MLYLFISRLLVPSTTFPLLYSDPAHSQMVFQNPKNIEDTIPLQFYHHTLMPSKWIAPACISTTKWPKTNFKSVLHATCVWLLWVCIKHVTTGCAKQHSKWDAVRDSNNTHSYTLSCLSVTIWIASGLTEVSPGIFLSFYLLDTVSS